MATDENSWKTQNFRQSVIAKIDEVVQSSGMPTTRNSIDMENHVFQKAKTKEEYLGFVARLILHVRELNSKKGAGGAAPGTAGSGNQGMPDPIGALQTLARQGTGINQMMSMSGPGSNPQGIIQQQPTNTATNYNSDAYNKLMNSPSQVPYRQYIERRNNEEKLHEFWKDTLHEKKNHAKEIKKQCGMAVDLTDNRVSYIYKPVISSIEGIKFIITLKYIKLLRKWYISLGYSRLPEVIKLDNKIKNGVYNPVGKRVLNMVHEIKILLDNFVQRLTYVHQVIDKVKETYRDIQFDIDKSLVYLKVLLIEKGWSKNLEKISSKDIIIFKLKLDENLQTEDIAFEYICEESIPKKIKKMCIDKLENVIKIFFFYPLMEAFEKFMNEEISVENEHFEEVSPSS